MFKELLCYKLKTLTVCAALLLLPDFGNAANFVWGNGSGNWNDGFSWGGTAPNGTDASDTLTFGGSVAVPYLSTNDVAIVPFQLDRIIVAATDAGLTGTSHEIAGNALRFMNPGSQIAVNDTGSVTLKMPIEFENNATLTVTGTGAGTVTLNGGVKSFADIFKSGNSTLRFGKSLDRTFAGERRNGAL